MIHRFPVERLISWYKKNKRDLPWRKTGDIYHIWVAEVMLQQTQAVTVIPYYHKFIGRFPTLRSLAAAEEGEVLKMWEGLGYYSRARNLLKAVRMVLDSHAGNVPVQPEAFRKLPGVGEYITAAVLSIARGLAIPVVDGNVLRVFTRFAGMKKDIRRGATRREIFQQLKLVIPYKRAADFNQALMELGAMVCRPISPFCADCPLKNSCLAFETGQQDRLPMRAPRIPPPLYHVSVAVIFRGSEIYIQKRPSNGHLGGLWEFPGGKRIGREPAEKTLLRECKEELGVQLKIIKKLSVISHAYSHFRIRLTPFICWLTSEVFSPPPDLEYRWITIDDLEKYPFPRANHKIFPQLREYFNNK